MTNVRSLIVAMAAMGVTLGAWWSIAAGQEKGSEQFAKLRVQWELETTRGAWRNFCGRVYNDREVPARHVVILFEGFDSAGQEVSRRFGEVIGDVPASGYSIFCLMVPAKGSTYRVTIPSVEWGYSMGQ